MPVEFIYFLILVGTFVISAFALKLPASVSMLVASVLTLIASGNGLNIMHLI